MIAGIRLAAWLLISLILSLSRSFAQETPVRLAIIGLTHDHAAGFLPRLKGRAEVDLAGIIEAKPELVARYAKRFNLDTNLFYPTLSALLAHTNIQAVATFTSTFEHKAVVEECAQRHINVMMEKPLAVNMQHARAIATAAKAGGIQVIVNYETTWYPGNREAWRIANEEQAIGELRKIVVHDGHRGPKEIGCSQDFLDWLTDPVKNGGGALMDFGCYGADLATWLMGGQKPICVFAVTQQIKPDVYPKVEDEATIVLKYPKAQAILQASWNWPFDRKDMEVYGKTGYVFVPRPNVVRIRKANGAESELTPPAIEPPEADPISYLAAVVRGRIKPSGLSSLEVNLIVTEILEAATRSAKTGKAVTLN